MKNGIHQIGFRAGKKLVSLACEVKNGFRNRLTILKSSYGVVPGTALLLVGLVALIAAFVIKPIAGGILAVGAAVRIKKDGLAADKVAFIDDLNARLELVDVADKAAVDLSVRQAVADHFKDIDLNQIREMLGDDPKSIRSILKLHGQQLTEIQNRSGKTEDVSIRGQVERYIETNKEQIDKARLEKRGANLPALHIRAAATMLESTNLANNPTPIANPYLPRPGVQPGIIDLIRVQPTFWDYLTKGATKLNPYIWVNKRNVQGAAAFTAEGALKPLVSFNLETESSTPKKAAERMKVSTELLSDVDGLTSEINNELLYQVKTAANTGVLTGNGAGVNPKGVTTVASLYTLATLNGTIAPNNADCVRAAIAQLRTLNFNLPLTAFMNPVDLAAMDLQKSLQGQYVLPPFTTVDGRIIAATPVVEDNNIAQGYLLIGDMSKYRILMYEDIFITWGWENDDFTKNLTTVIAEMRFHQFVSENHTAGFIYDTFANIKAAIS